MVGYYDLNLIKKPLTVKSPTTAPAGSATAQTASAPGGATADCKDAAGVHILLSKSGNGLWVAGETQQHCEFLTKTGGLWNQPRKAWVFSRKKHEVLLLQHFNMGPHQIIPEESFWTK